MPQILSIQYLRAVAAILVVAVHSSTIVRSDFANDFPVLKFGEFGVDIFFVISGFIMWTIAAARPLTPAMFLERRLVRIAPLYWALTIPTALISTDNGFHIDFAADWAAVARSFLFIPDWNAAHSLVTPVLFVGWTLNLEMFFYVVFAFTLLLSERRRLFTAAAILFALAGTRLHIGVSDNPAINLYTNSIVGEFAFGILLGYAYQNGLSKFAARRDAWKAGLVLLLAGIAAIPFRAALTDARILHFGVPALMVVAGALLLETRIARHPLPALKFCGDASYSIYLVHIMAQAVSIKFAGPLFGADHPALAVVLQTAFGVAAGSAVHLLLERPLTAWARRAATYVRALLSPAALAAAFTHR